MIILEFTLTFTVWTPIGHARMKQRRSRGGGGVLGPSQLLQLRPLFWLDVKLHIRFVGNSNNCNKSYQLSSIISSIQFEMAFGIKTILPFNCRYCLGFSSVDNGKLEIPTVVSVNLFRHRLFVYFLFCF